MSRSFAHLTGFAVTAFLSAVTTVHAQATAPAFARIFTDHAVVQRDEPITVWGTAAPAQSVTVSLNGKSVAAKADAAGKWRATLPAMTAGGPYALTATAGGATVTRNDIAVGDVYLCGGQSNMEFATRNATNAWGNTMSSSNKDIRFVNIQKDSQPGVPGDLNMTADWKVAGPDTIGDSSAVCYFMARSLQKDLKIPVGFIHSSWGGTAIQSWISPASLRTVPVYVQGVDTVTGLATDPVKAMAGEAARQEAWWDANDPDAKAQRAFIAPGYDDSAWPSLTPTGSWKDAGIAEFKDFDGVAWFRTTVELTADQAAKANDLQLGPIDTFDTTWVNGVRVGGNSVSWVWRDYKVPAGVFKAGRNVIAIRVLSGGGGGGLTGQTEHRGVKTSDGQFITLTQPWTYKLGMRAKGLSLPPAPWDIPNSLTTLHNGMIAPLAGYKFKLAAWYQGESNAWEAKQYQTLLPLLMKDWRQTFGQPELPFLVVQLTAYGSVATQPGKSQWAELREAQALTVKKDPHAGMAVTIDFGDRSDIHPTQKTIVGERLARAARAVAYGQSITPGGPEATAVTRSGNDLVITFKDTNGGLRTYSSDTAIGFETCTGDTCRYALAVASGDTVTLKDANRPDVTRVRYAWADSPFVNLFSADDLPAGPFQLTVQ